MRLASPPPTIAGSRRKRRFRSVAFLVKMCRRLARPCVIFPLPVRRNRLATLLFVFIFGILFPLSVFHFGYKKNLKAIAFHHRSAFHARQILQIIAQPFQSLFAERLFDNFASAKGNKRLDAISALQKTNGIAKFDRIIGFAGRQTKFDFFDFHLFLPRFRFLPLFAFTVFKFSVIQQFAYAGAGVGGDFHQIQTERSRPFSGFGERDDTDLCAIGINQPYFRRGDVLIDAQIVLFFYASSFGEIS